ncbi:MAG: sugar ABC transporter permease [Patescibacteria group bacterium]|nr:MAG: sugar ABC transporter permease [Patescibacteria group bacterium]
MTTLDRKQKIRDAAALHPSRKLSKLQIREIVLGYLYISPWLLGYLALTLGPLLVSFYLSFTHYSIITPPRFIGIENYVRAFTQDTLFWRSIGNTLYFVTISVPLSITISLFLALLLDQGLSGSKLFRTLFFLPTITPVVASVLLWKWLFQPDFGILNYLLSLIGIQGPRWLASPEWVKPSLIIIHLWGTVGGSQMLIFLAGLQSIPSDLYEAAAIDGASGRKRLLYITLPLLTPSIFLNLILGIIAGFRVFTLAYIATEGGPAYSSLFYVLYLFFNAFKFMNMGYASAMAWILFIAVLALTAFQFRMSRRWVYYEAER